LIDSTSALQCSALDSLLSPINDETAWCRMRRLTLAPGLLTSMLSVGRVVVVRSYLLNEEFVSEKFVTDMLTHCVGSKRPQAAR